MKRLIIMTAVLLLAVLAWNTAAAEDAPDPVVIDKPFISLLLLSTAFTPRIVNVIFAINTPFRFLLDKLACQISVSS